MGWRRVGRGRGCDGAEVGVVGLLELEKEEGRTPWSLRRSQTCPRLMVRQVRLLISIQRWLLGIVHHIQQDPGSSPRTYNPQGNLLQTCTVTADTAMAA